MKIFFEDSIIKTQWQWRLVNVTKRCHFNTDHYLVNQAEIFHFENLYFTSNILLFCQGEKRGGKWKRIYYDGSGFFNNFIPFIPFPPFSKKGRTWSAARKLCDCKTYPIIVTGVWMVFRLLNSEKVTKKNRAGLKEKKRGGKKLWKRSITWGWTFPDEE